MNILGLALGSVFGAAANAVISNNADELVSSLDKVEPGVLEGYRLSVVSVTEAALAQGTVFDISRVDSDVMNEYETQVKLVATELANAVTVTDLTRIDDVVLAEHDTIISQLATDVANALTITDISRLDPAILEAIIAEAKAEADAVLVTDLTRVDVPTLTAYVEPLVSAAVAVEAESVVTDITRVDDAVLAAYVDPLVVEAVTTSETTLITDVTRLDAALLEELDTISIAEGETRALQIGGHRLEAPAVAHYYPNAYTTPRINLRNILTTNGQFTLTTLPVMARRMGYRFEIAFAAGEEVAGAQFSIVAEIRDQNESSYMTPITVPCVHDVSGAVISDVDIEADTDMGYSVRFSLLVEGVPTPVATAIEVVVNVAPINEVLMKAVILGGVEDPRTGFIDPLPIAYEWHYATV